MKARLLLPIVLMVVFALSRIPGVMPQNFSAAYALVFCAGVYFPARLAWWLPLATLLVTDVLLNGLYYHVHLVRWEMLGNYLAYGVLLWLGRQFSPRSHFLSLLTGGLLGAILFYLVSNTASWLSNPEYNRNLAGWIQALTTGTPGWPQTWEFFRGTMMSGGLFTGLFAGAMKLLEAAEPAEEKEPAEEDPEEAGEKEPCGAVAEGGHE